MNNNKDNYKKAIDKIHASEELKEKAFQKMKTNVKPKNNIVYMKFLAACAMIVAVFSVGMFYKGPTGNDFVSNNKDNNIAAKEEINLPRFKDIEELKTVLAKNTSRYTKGDIIFETFGSSMDIAATESSVATDSSSASNSLASGSSDTKSHSTTNTQVENVDEADIVKTDGEYIYYITNRKISIVEAENLEKVSTIEIDSSEFTPEELYIYKDKLIVLGSGWCYGEDTKNSIYEYRRSKTLTFATVYDVSNIEEPKLKRTAKLEGSYKDSRMIEDTLYFISQKYISYYKDSEDLEILPIVYDSVVSKVEKCLPVTDIAYFENVKNNCYTLLGGFNVLEEDEMNTEVILGASDTIYVSENNLYLTQDEYKSLFGIEKCYCSIYKFNLDDSKIKLQCKGEFDGYLNNQFSMDEYEGNLRIATTAGLTDYTNNKIYILDENLEQIGLVENLARGEKIYSVRFMGKVGYVVTFKQIDPLFVIDLSDPTNPVVKGELKIPGYSSYLHPYDENHIIGIGYNVKVSEYGSVSNTNMKMSMFDVSDLENPKEMFSVDIGADHAYSEINSNHKALFYHKDKNLIGFPVTSYGYSNYNSRNVNSFPIFEIDLEEGFKEYGEILASKNGNYYSYIDSIRRAIYIEDVIYILSSNKIISYDMETLEEIKVLELK